MKIIPEDLEDILRFKLSDKVRQMVINFDLEYRALDQDERDDYILMILEEIGKPKTEIGVAGPHRINQWENGWNENFKKFKESGSNLNCLIPKYHSKYRIARWENDLVFSKIEGFDYKSHICIVDAVLDHYTKDCHIVREFGCGPAYHLIRYNQRNPSKLLFGHDWAKSSQEIINLLGNPQIKGSNFDFFNPPTMNVALANYDKTAIYTVAALEQVGGDFIKFVDFLLLAKPTICIHLEPIEELLDPRNLLHNLSIRYFRKRGYLNKFLPYLEQLEKDKKIEIIDKRRTGSGSLFIEGHSLVVWKPK